jgi:hypothetical protein
MCDCLLVTFQVVGETTIQSIEANVSGTYGGLNVYEFTWNEVTYTIWNDGSWEVTTDGVDGVDLVTFWEGGDPCPTASMPTWTDQGYFSTFTTAPCTFGCTCIKLKWTIGEITQYFNAEQAGIYDGFYFYQFVSLGSTYTIYYSSADSRWYFVKGEEGTTLDIIAELVLDVDCPIAPHWDTFGDYTVVTRPCGCDKREDRIFREVGSIKLPEVFIEQNRGLKDCCCKYYVLASAENDGWKNDVTSAWIKLSDVSDTHSFELYKDGQLTNYVCTSDTFVNEQNAYYTTIEWADVLASDGIGCYALVVNFEISGITGQFTWGKYDLKEYSIQNALKTARIKAIFNGYQQTDGIDFTASNVVSTHRFFGFIGNRQPNSEIDNIIYENREMKRVIRENLNDYEIITEPSDECIIKPMIDLYLLSENQLFISDYNAHNHSYRYFDVPVIVAESPSIEYKDYSRKATLTCKVSDKFKTNRTYYNG